MASGLALNVELSKILNKLWDADENRLVPGKDYVVSLQGRAGFVPAGQNNARDNASRPLFSYVNEERLKSITSYSAFMLLLDNYEMSTGIAETLTEEEIAEENHFLDIILETKVMKLAHQYLVEKNLAEPDLKDFKTQLYKIWFQLYSRTGNRGKPDSSGFEHVFVGETKRGHEIMGFHNWIQFYLQEKRNNIDYKGYVARRNKSRPDEDDQVLNLQFSWKHMVKPVGSTFIGVSPEFEFALYTVVFLMSGGKVSRERVMVDEYELQIVVYRYGKHIGTSYAILFSSNNEDLF
ncbi:uridylate-specific endoribonuclease C [Latimeria chalumnae]|uniref:Uridylate-specific endoribonuclease n=1 Tax=Latimeria chalumnae TaxID=7897 RepID=H3BBJ8_LATCH|nr:PREDICTED: poly(U)-specific endoribonuclease-A-like [Latimeria chalumnae]|eukprot:XP_005990888.1 PREDICTED: poly(U)-specific endoribonuclease-A-like [Latimeria chalumnae]